MKCHDTIIKTQKLNEDTYLIRIESNKIATLAKSGQFVNIRCGDGTNAYLRRPISILSVDRSNSTFDIAYQVRGKGTRILSDLKPNDKIDIMGPLGNGFAIDPNHSHIGVVGGGIGVFPLLGLLKDHPAHKKVAFLGFRTKDAVVMEDEFNKHCHDLLIATDDGSYGYKGFVTSLLAQKIDIDRPDMIYFCGPEIMMKTGVQMLRQLNIPCEVSMEQRMGCGIGACLVCACKTRKADGWDYSRVCKDGPVFRGEDVFFD